MRSAQLIALALVLGGCATHSLKMYEGPEKPVSEVATVRLWSPGVIVRSIDGKPAMSTGRESHAYLNPGDHEFKVSHVVANTPSNPVTLRALTRAGRTYVFGFQLYGKDQVSFFIEDKGRNYDLDCLISRPGAKGGIEGKDC